jgi:hypothetical protein
VPATPARATRGNDDVTEERDDNLTPLDEFQRREVLAFLAGPLPLIAIGMGEGVSIPAIGVPLVVKLVYRVVRSEWPHV